MPVVDGRRVVLMLLGLLGLFSATPEPSVTPLATTPEMRHWVDRHLGRIEDPEARWRRLGRRLVSSRVRVETPLRTTTAATTFNEGRGNCVGFAHLVVALAREAGLDAHFVLVDDPAPTLRRGDLRVVQRHLAAAFGEGDDASVLDLGGRRRAGPGDHPVSDATARAIFFSNRGVERLLAGEPEEAGRWLRSALAADPSLAPVWVNLGVAERRSGRPRLAALAYRLALVVEPGTPAARGNLALLDERRSPAER